MPSENPDLKELKKALILARNKYLFSKGLIKADDMESENVSEDCCPKDDYLYSMCDYLYRYITSVDNSLWSYITSHQKGHLPPINGADKMSGALKALKIDGDYDVYKPTIYANKKGGIQVDI